jgi:Mrp family chromosome partitioning ATPase
MSIQFLLQDGDQAVVWRGPRKNNLIQQFLTQTDWTGETDGLDYLIVDTPPGTSDEHISIVQYLQKAEAVSGAIVVTTPEEVSLSDVRKELSFCRKTKLPVLGVIENMSSYQTHLDRLRFERNGVDCTDSMLSVLKEKCPEALECTVSSQLFSPSRGGAEKMSHDYGVEFWGRLPLDPDLLKACEAGQGYVETHPSAPASLALKAFCETLVHKLPVDMSPAQN